MYFIVMKPIIIQYTVFNCNVPRYISLCTLFKCMENPNDCYFAWVPYDSIVYAHLSLLYHNNNHWYHNAPFSRVHYSLTGLVRAYITQPLINLIMQWNN